MSKIKKSLAKRDMRNDYAELIQIPREYRDKCKKYGYDKCLKVVFYGDPISDSRPKTNKLTGGVHLPNQEKMEVIFNNLLNRSELLQNLTIKSYYHIAYKYYVSATQKDIKLFKKDSKLWKDYTNEKLMCLYREDLDNEIKLSNDIMFTRNKFILLTDSFNPGIFEAEQWISPNPRSEVLYFFTEKVKNKYYKEVIERSSDWSDYLLSKKHMTQNNRSYADQVDYMKRFIKLRIKDLNTEKQMSSFISYVSKRIEVEYSADDIKGLAKLEKDLKHKFNKNQAIIKVLHLIFKGNKLAEQILNKGGKVVDAYSRNGIDSNEYEEEWRID